MRKKIYTGFVSRFGSHQWHPLFQHTATFIQAVLKLSTFNYGGIKLLAGPVAYLDRFIIQGKNINPLVTSALRQHLKKGGVFLDIGANHGVFSLLAAKNPNVNVFAFEPSSRELTRFWKNLALNPSNNISVLSYGIGDSEKKQPLALAPSINPGINSLPIVYHSDKSELCNFTTLINLLSEHVLSSSRVCKLDVEGQELIILRSLQPYMTLLKKCVFIVEISPPFLSKLGQTAEDIYAFFSQAGFRYQLGPQLNQFQWDDIFYHPEHTYETTITEELA